MSTGTRSSPRPTTSRTSPKGGETATKPLLPRDVRRRSVRQWQTITGPACSSPARRGSSAARTRTWRRSAASRRPRRLALHGRSFRRSSRTDRETGIWNASRTPRSDHRRSTTRSTPNESTTAPASSWDQHLHHRARNQVKNSAFTIINRTQVPTAWQVSPITQTLTAGPDRDDHRDGARQRRAAVRGQLAALHDRGRQPPERRGDHSTPPARRTISYVGHNAGLDTIQMFLDLAGTGTQTAQDPAGTAQVTWLRRRRRPTAATRSEHQSQLQRHDHDHVRAHAVRTGDAEVTVPTGTIARREAASRPSTKPRAARRARSRSRASAGRRRPSRARSRRKASPAFR